MKVLKNEQKVAFDDLREVKCSVCDTRMWDQGNDVSSHAKINCPKCGTVYRFEPIKWRGYIA